MIEITTLGNFSISVNGTDVSECFKKTKKLLQLLNFLIISKHKPLPIKVICEAIWGEDYGGDECKALHNLIYRLRSIFSKHDEPDFVNFCNQSYMLNPALDLRVDIHIIDDYYKRALNARLPVFEKMRLLEEADKLYNGEYMLNHISNDVYVQTVTMRYKRLYTDIVCRLADIYIINENYDGLFLLCDKAMELEPLEESIYLRAVKGMRKKGMDTQAIQLIEQYFDLLYREEGTCASNALVTVYKELKNTSVNSLNDIENALTELRDAHTKHKPVFLDINTFNDVYKNELLSSNGKDYMVAVALIEIDNAEDD